MPEGTAAQEGQGDYGQPVDNFWTNWKSVFLRDLGLTKGKTTSFTENIKLGYGRDFISSSSHQDFRACNPNDCGEMFGAGRHIICIPVCSSWGGGYKRRSVVLFFFLNNKWSEQSTCSRTGNMPPPPFQRSLHLVIKVWISSRDGGFSGSVVKICLPIQET